MAENLRKFSRKVSESIEEIGWRNKVQLESIKKINSDLIELDRGFKKLN